MQSVKQSVGIDIAKLSFTACISKRTSLNEKIILSEVKLFKNTKPGFNQFLKWVAKNIDKKAGLVFAMEATGIYYEKLAYHLHKLGKKVSVLLPNKVTHFTKSLNIKSKTDNIDASVIAIMSCERSLFEWSPPSQIFKKLRAITRAHQALQEDKTQIINRLKQLKCGFEPLKDIIAIYHKQIKSIDTNLKKLIVMMKETLQSDSEIWVKTQNIMTIKGIGLKTIAAVLAETQGFELIKNQRQLVSYSGYDVVKRESGTSIKGRTKISKKGNSRLRRAMYMPSVSAIRYNPPLKNIYDRINKGKLVKGIGLVAVQRRLLVLIYSLWKSNSTYDVNYQKNKASGNKEKEVSSSLSTLRVDTHAA